MIKAYRIIFYENDKGVRPIAEFIKELRKQSATNKTARINYSKIVAYINILEKEGTIIGEPITKHLDGEIWELRPLDNRILYAYFEGNTFILLHHFQKKTQKTPPQEIKQAIRNLKDYRERNDK